MLDQELSKFMYDIFKEIMNYMLGVSVPFTQSFTEFILAIATSVMVWLSYKTIKNSLVERKQLRQEKEFDFLNRKCDFIEERVHGLRLNYEVGFVANGNNAILSQGITEVKSIKKGLVALDCFVDSLQALNDIYKTQYLEYSKTFLMQLSIIWKELLLLEQVKKTNVYNVNYIEERINIIVYPIFMQMSILARISNSKIKCTEEFNAAVNAYMNYRNDLFREDIYEYDNNKEKLKCEISNN